ncbi:unnamed protein product [Parascedosporium putredinis]|uniref:Biogenesis of lysosome-related organelles complex 1 subunit 1 n=1 Tax=Parascedosporium putredinis TaxID=1442378 RepID=A0A9P1GXT3_9PEZI|nr:unnamed protein product [Parascedosporium putredinis]CAI7989322.1 unnamed protein product [Parascedosporium putredinis]
MHDGTKLALAACRQPYTTNSIEILAVLAHAASEAPGFNVPFLQCSLPRIANRPLCPHHLILRGGIKRTQASPALPPRQSLHAVPRYVRLEILLIEGNCLQLGLPYFEEHHLRYARRDSPPPLSADHTAEARAALIASISNLVDTELTPRAQALHAGAAALTRQERDVTRATAALRAENEKLEKLASGAARDIKMIGSVQNWAEVLERDFVVLEETVRLVRDGCGSDCCSCPDLDEMARKLAALNFGAPAPAIPTVESTAAAPTLLDAVSPTSASTPAPAPAPVSTQPVHEQPPRKAPDLDRMARKLAALNFATPSLALPTVSTTAATATTLHDISATLPIHPSPLAKSSPNTAVAPESIPLPPDTPADDLYADGDHYDGTTSRASLSESSRSLVGTESPFEQDRTAAQSDTTSLATTI